MGERTIRGYTASKQFSDNDRPIELCGFKIVDFGMPFVFTESDVPGKCFMWKYEIVPNIPGYCYVRDERNGKPVYWT